ncbi:hypothetical protein HAX54_046631, partial [Datura stramonium]|nr:hypothetical protein [Datura stramonium]
MVHSCARQQYTGARLGVRRWPSSSIPDATQAFPCATVGAQQPLSQCDKVCDVALSPHDGACEAALDSVVASGDVQ